MKEKVSPFLRQLSDRPHIRKQYYVSADETNADYDDPLMEDSHEVVKGLVHKYPNRALLKVSYLCAAHCRFCTRIRQIGNPNGTLREGDIEPIAAYIRHHQEIDDVILSGGDPLYTPQLTEQILMQLQEIESVKVLRIGTRLPFQSPQSFRTAPLQRLLATVDAIGRERPFFILLHIEHPDELTPETIAVVRQLRELKVTLLSQTVFLKGINDNFETLHALFQHLYYLGVIPYYLFHCDNVKGLEHFQGDKVAEKAIAVRLRAALSGIATPLFAEDLENGYGKVPV